MIVGYSREAYLNLVERVRQVIPGIALSGDMIAGFCGETDSDFEETLSLIRSVKYTNLFTFAYSLREVNIYYYDEYSRLYFCATFAFCFLCTL